MIIVSKTLDMQDFYLKMVELLKRSNKQGVNQSSQKIRADDASNFEEYMTIRLPFPS